MLAQIQPVKMSGDVVNLDQIVSPTYPTVPEVGHLIAASTRLASPIAILSVHMIMMEGRLSFPEVLI